MLKKLESNDCTTKNIKVKNESTPVYNQFFDYEDVKPKKIQFASSPK